MAKNIFVNDVKVHCRASLDCTTQKKELLLLVGPYDNTKLLEEKLNQVFLEKDNSYFSYFLSNRKDNTLYVNLIPEKILRSIKIEIKGKKIDIASLETKISSLVGEKFISDQVDKNLSKIFYYLRDHGIGKSQIEIKRNIEGYNVDVVYHIDSSAIYKLKNIIFEYKNTDVDNTYLSRSFVRLYGKKWSRLKFKTQVDELYNELILEGYYHAKVQTSKPIFNETLSSVVVNIQIDKGDRFGFTFRGNKSIPSIVLKRSIIEKLKNTANYNISNLIKKSLKYNYEKRSFFNISISLRQTKSKDRFGNHFTNYYIDLKEKNKNQLIDVSFEGNSIVSTKEIRTLFYEKASSLAWRNYLDVNFLKKFSEILKDLYYKKGFIFIDISDPIIKISFDKSTSRVIYKIKERVQCKVRSISINGLSDRLRADAIQLIKNKVGSYLNVVSLEKDIESIVELTRNNGYYFSKVVNYKQKELLKYSANYSDVDIVINIEPGNKTVFESLKVIGLKKTKQVVIEREIQLKVGEILTTSKIQLIKNRLSSLGLFSFIKISTFISSVSRETNVNNVNLFIQVKEKDFGMGEVSPGYRTDLGLKFGAMLSYNNLGGKNRLLSVKLQGNLRDSFRDFDSRRKENQDKFIEYSVKFLYEEPYLLHSLLGTKIEFDISTTYQKKRYYSFDANIAKVSPTISKLFGQHFLASFQYQLESIELKDGTELKDNDRFRIGSIIPSFSIDFRDDTVMPRSGNYFAASYEIANSNFGSMKEEDLTIDYTKLIVRNKNYLNFGNFVFATSLSAGVEKNFATATRENKSEISDTIGYIPSIKVFRLEGNDTVRGFQNTEINRLSDGRDIGQVVVNNKAFFVNVKIEPRYLVNDMFLVALFYDAGRVFIDHFKPLDLRSSFGTSLKVLTPVGSLNFDYGIKFRRASIDHGKEKFGRFHLSIGFF